MNAVLNIRGYPARWLRVYYRPQQAFSMLETGYSTREWSLILVVIMAIVLCAGVATLPIALDKERDLIETELKSHAHLSTLQRAIILREASQFDARQLVSLVIMPASVCFFFGAWSIIGKHCAGFVFGKNLPYEKVLPITGYAMLVLVPETVIKIVWIFLLGSFDLPFHLGVLRFGIDPESPPGMYLAGVDLFGIWFLYLLGLGLAQTFRGSFKATWFVLGSIWCVWILIRSTLERLGTVYV